MAKDKAKKVTKATAKTNIKKGEVLKWYKKKLANVTFTCEAAKINRTTFYKWKNTSVKFAEQLQQIDNELIELAETTLYQRAFKKSDTCLIFLLKNKRPEVWGDKIKLTGKVDSDIQVNSLSGLSTAELEKLAAYGTNKRSKKDNSK